MTDLKLVFRSVNRRCQYNQFLLVLVHGCRWTQAASGAAGRANVGLGFALHLLGLVIVKGYAFCSLSLRGISSLFFSIAVALCPQ